MLGQFAACLVLALATNEDFVGATEATMQLQETIPGPLIEELSKTLHTNHVVKLANGLFARAKGAIKVVSEDDASISLPPVIVQGVVTQGRKNGLCKVESGESSTV